MFCLAGRQVHSQSTITIVPNVTRVTDATTGQLVGPGFSVAIFWASSPASDPNAFLQLGPNMTIVNGLLPGGTRTLPTPGVGSVSLFAGAWETQYGASYDAAAQVFGAKVGRSAIVDAVPGGPAVRIPDFQVSPVPETSTCALLGLGLLALATRYRRSCKTDS